MEEDFHVLAAGMKHFQHILVRHQVIQGLQVNIRCQRIDGRRFVGAGDLDQAEPRPVCAVTQKFGIDGDIIGVTQALAECCEAFAVCNWYDFHGCHEYTESPGGKRPGAKLPSFTSDTLTIRRNQCPLRAEIPNRRRK